MAGSILLSNEAFQRSRDFVSHYEGSPVNSLSRRKRKRRSANGKLKFALIDIWNGSPSVGLNTGFTFGSTLMAGVKGNETGDSLFVRVYNRSEGGGDTPAAPQFAIVVMMDNGWEMIAAEIPA